MKIVYDAFMQNEIWELVFPLKEGKVIENKWIYGTKLKAYYNLEKFKSRFIVKGFLQVEGINYTENFIHIFKPTTILIILTFVLQFDWSIRKLDVNNVFFN